MDAESRGTIKILAWAKALAFEILGADCVERNPRGAHGRPTIVVACPGCAAARACLPVGARLADRFAGGAKPIGRVAIVGPSWLTMMCGISAPAPVSALA